VADPVIVLAFHLLLLFIGTVVYVMQLWFRAWKEHYLLVCLNIRKHIEAAPNPEGVFPYWLRDIPTDSGRFSFDNLIMYVTLLVNFGVLFLIAQDTQDLMSASSAASLVIAGTSLAYVGLVVTVNVKMRGSAFLPA
jgi:hypothetical protein